MSNILYDPLISGLNNLLEYLSQHTLTCLIPAFFIAGAIAAFVKKDAVLRYFGPDVKKRISYPIAAVSGTVLAVCSCTILPLFAGIYKKGSGIGPATAFLYSGPAINVLAIVYTARILGFDLGFARAVAAVFISLIVGLLMAWMFRKGEKKTLLHNKKYANDEKIGRPSYITLLFFSFLIAILLVGASNIDWLLRLSAIYLMTVAEAAILIYYYSRDEVTEWGYEIWDLTKKIFPLLIAGTFVVGVIAYFLPPETFGPYLGGNSLFSNFTAAVIGAILYMPTLLEVPIIGTTFGYSSGVIGSGPALALLLAGPGVSLPNMAVLYRIMGAKKTATYIGIVVVFSTVAGFIYGNLVG